MGVDVSVNRGLDVVVLGGALDVLAARSNVAPDELSDLLSSWRPRSVAIDSPPGRGRTPAARSRHCERQLREQGIQIFLTPSDADRYAHPFYDWIRVGERVYAAARRAGYPPQANPTDVVGRALEVFPHASDVCLRGCLPPAGTTRRVRTKRAWRSATLRDAGVDTERLCHNRVGQPTLDSIDAGLAAVTAWYAVQGDFRVAGDAGEWIVLPGRVEGPFGRLSRPKGPGNGWA